MSFRRLFSLICIALGVLCIMAAAGIVWKNHMEDMWAERAGAEIIEEMRYIMDDAERNALRQENMSLPSAEGGVQPSAVPGGAAGTAAETAAGTDAVAASGTARTPVIEIGGLEYIGYLRFPALEAEFPVMAEWDYERLKIAPCRYYGSVETDDLVIAGHNYRSTFGMLSKLREGDDVVITDAEGTEHFYRVSRKEVLDAAEIEDMTNSGWDLSLFTCTYDRVHRLTVRCRKIDNYSFRIIL